MDYKFKQIEEKWSKAWSDTEIYKVGEDPNKKKFYVLDMFPYPSGAGLHVGHPLGYIASDIIARYKRLNGYNVLHPMGYDSFGLPAEQYAIESGQHPAITTKKNISKYRKQLDKIGFCFDWSREIQTSSPNYYLWTQWIFKQLFESYYCNIENKALPITQLIEKFKSNGNKFINSPCDKNTPNFCSKDWNLWSEEKQQKILLKYRLAYISETVVNWCEDLGTVLANDEVKDGFSERGSYPVTQKKMKQWSLRITAYSERLLNDLESLDWSESIKEMQKNWIGKSEGLKLSFEIYGFKNQKIEVFTTRPDTIFGVSFIVIAPESKYTEIVTTTKQKNKIQKYCASSSKKSERDRQTNNKKYTGIFSGSYAIHPITKKKLPIWISDYVLGSYGTGAIMAVPCGDQRDWEFAKKFKLKIPNVFSNVDTNEKAYTEKSATITDSDFLNNLDVPSAIKKAISYLNNKGLGTVQTNYRLRDAVFSRQRFWGEPFPVYYKNNIPYMVEDKKCVKLPKIDKYLPTKDGEPPLARANKSDWNIFKGDRMEYNTMPGWAGSSWYFLRFMDPLNKSSFVDIKKSDYWNQVDLYVGGAEHAVGHLLYSRFWTKFLNDRGFINFNEPFKKLLNQGMILGRSNFVYRKKGTNTFITYEKISKFNVSKVHVDIELVKNDILDLNKFKNWRSEYRNSKFLLNENGKYRCGFEIEKMSKSKYNTQNPDSLIEKYGADTLRMYEMFLGPIEQFKPWNTNGINGVHNFLKKFWKLLHHDHKFSVNREKLTTEEEIIINDCIKNVTKDIDKLMFNTCVSHLMTALNNLIKLKCNKYKVVKDFTRLLFPFAPFISSEVWEMLGEKELINDSGWPKYKMNLGELRPINLPISFNGKYRYNIDIDQSLSIEKIKEIVSSNPKTIHYLGSKKIKKIIIVPKKIVNIVF